MSFTTIRHSGVPENTHSAVSTSSWRIGEKPYDPLDPGPYGSPGWRPDPRRGRRRHGELPDPLPEAAPGFSPLREAAYRDFLRDSEELHLAHLAPPEPSRVLVYLRWYLQIVVAILYWRVLPFPESPSRCRRSRAACEVRQSDRYVGRVAVAPRAAAASAVGFGGGAASATGSGPHAFDRSGPGSPYPIPTQRPVSVEWRTASPSPTRPSPARRAAPPGSRPPVRPLPVMAPRNAALHRRRVESRTIFLHGYGMTRDQNLRNLTWPRGSWEGFTPTDAYANPRRGAIQRRRNRRPRNLALPRSFPSTIPVVPVGATSRPAPVGPARRLVPVPAPAYPVPVGAEIGPNARPFPIGANAHPFPIGASADAFRFGGLR